MFEVCRHREGICTFAATSTYDPYTGKADGLPYTFCGQANGADTRVAKLEKCWDDMSKGERTRHAKNTTDKIMPKRGYVYNKTKKAWEKII